MELEALELLKPVLKRVKLTKEDLEYKNEAEKRQKTFQLLLKLQFSAFLQNQNEANSDFEIKNVDKMIPETQNVSSKIKILVNCVIILFLDSDLGPKNPKF